MPYENTKINFIFLRSLKGIERFDVDDMLSKGLNPFANVDLTNAKAGPNDGGPENLFLHTLYVNDEEAVIKILRHTEKIRKPIDLSQPYPCDEAEKRQLPMSTLQYAIKVCKPDIQKLLCEYQAKHFPADQNANKSMAEIFNQKFQEKGNAGKYQMNTSGISVLESISIQHLVFNRTIYAPSEDDEDEANDFFSDWLWQLPSVPMPNLPRYIAGSDENQLKVKINIHNHAMATLLAHGFDPNLKGESGISTARLLQDLVHARTNQQELAQFIRRMKFDKRISNITIVDLGDGTYGLEFSLTNMFFAHRITMVCIFNHKPLEELQLQAKKLMPAVTPPVNRQLVQFQRQLQNHETRLLKNEEQTERNTQDIKQIFAKLNRFTESKYFEAIDNLQAYPFHQGVFVALHKKLESFIRQKGDASLRVFPALPSGQRWMAAQAAATLFSIGGQLCPVPYASILPGLAQAALSAYTEFDNSRQNKAIFNFDMNPHAMATFISSRLSAEAMLRYGNKPATTKAIAGSKAIVNSSKFVDPDAVVNSLFAKVKSQLAQVRNHKFGDAIEAIVFLCDTAITDLRNSRTSSDSLTMSNHSGGGLALLTDSPQRNKQLQQTPRRVQTTSKNAGGRCAVM
ncbi:MAG TPA: hypothetical protein VLG38_07360 [Gammaproteobacteria bacterium]|nr:hypothetical protein [Gammaproteobacteria bacterium]